MFPEKTERKSSIAVAKTIAFEMTKFGYPGQSGVSQAIQTGCEELLAPDRMAFLRDSHPSSER